METIRVGLVADPAAPTEIAGRMGNLRPSREDGDAWHVELLSDARTLTDQDVAKFLERVAREVQTLGGELRRE